RSHLIGSEAFLAAYSALLIKTCHRRGCFAIGSTAQIPDRDDQARADQEYQARNGLDGTGVANPDLVPPALKIFNELMPTSNHLYVARDDVKVGQKELLEIHKGTRTEVGFRRNIRVFLYYAEAWFRGHGVIALDNMMIDTASAEIARAQIWQWLKLELKLDGGQRTTRKFFDACLADEMKRVKEEAGAEAYGAGRFKEALALLKALAASKTFVSFFTLPAGEKIQH
ncbi:MAG: malate synthase A, partial [Rhizobiales bacterium]|nr:malate synthase A [Hyphomicrobiales bacterium]